jgi:hypothetical protein
LFASQLAHFQVGATHQSLFLDPILARELKGNALCLLVQLCGLTFSWRGFGDLPFLSRRLELRFRRRTLTSGLQLRRRLFPCDANRGGDEDLSLAGVSCDHRRQPLHVHL